MPSARVVVQALRTDEQAWLAKHRAPALVFDALGPAASGQRLDTPDQPFFFTRERMPLDAPPDLADVGESTDVQHAALGAATGTTLEGVRPDTRIEWLVKSARNPFGALITVGRTNNNDVVVPHTTVSKVHAIFSDNGRGWSISDAGSSNGTYIDGVRLPPRERRSIDDGAELRFGQEVRARFAHPASLLELLRVVRRLRRDGWA